jgi:P4 family phage/plasmid primase-like protien
MTPPLLEWALRYIRLGWPVIPLRGKIPRVTNGSKDASLNEKQVRTWWEMWPDANIGVATSHRFFVLDVDIKGGGEESYDYLRHQHGGFPPDTIQQVTGTGGRHLLFALPDFPVRNSTSSIAPGIDIRGAGGYIVVAPSIHPETNREYVWDGMAEIEDQPIAAAPAWLLDKLRNPGGSAAGGKPTARSAPEQIGEGHRNEQMFKLACSLRRKGLSEHEILATLKVSNDIRCQPPLPASELETIAKSSARYAPDERGNVFRGGQSRPQKQAAGKESDGSDELPLDAADVEAGIDDAIARNALIDAIKLAPDVGRLRGMMRAVITTKLRQHFGRDFPAREFERAMKDSGELSPPGTPPPDEEPPAGDGGAPDLRPFPHTDVGNGERIALLFADEVRYCVEMKRWLVWDGRRWAVDEMNAIRQRAKQMARLMYAQALGSTGSSALEKHARESESYSGISNALGCAASEKGIPVSAADLDQQPFLLNCVNGVVDLRDGKLLPHNREFLITKLCPVTYDPKAACARFLAFLHWAMGANPEAELTQRTVRLVGFLQRAFGYALTSDVSEKAVFILHGERGNNGKTTLLTLFRDLLGRDYSGQLVIDTVMTMKNQDATTRADLADLRGVRLVVTSEVEKEHRLNEGKIKYITAGMGNIKSCRKYENPIEFAATHKLFMDCNHRPTVRGVDDAIWRRLKLVPFDVTVSEEEKDLQLPDKLRAELPGILAWAVRGAIVWLKEGLGDPPEVSSAGAEWREHDDPLKEFIDDCCELGPGAYVRAQDLAAGYELWAKQNRERYPLGREAFNERLLAKGFKQSRSRRVEGKQLRTWEGIELRSDVAAAVSKQGSPAGGWLREP